MVGGGRVCGRARRALAEAQCAGFVELTVGIRYGADSPPHVLQRGQLAGRGVLVLLPLDGNYSCFSLLPVIVAVATCFRCRPA